MDQAGKQYACSEDALSEIASVAYKGVKPIHVVTSHFAVLPSKTLAWDVQHDAVLTVKGACVWLTRSTSDIDYWLADGETLVLRRGEQIWLSVEGDAVAEVALTGRYEGPVAGAGSFWAWLAETAKQFLKR